MTDYVKITVRVGGGRYILTNKKNGRERRKKFDIFHRPEELQGRIERVVELADENTIFDTTNDTINEIKEIYVKYFKEYLSEWYEEKYDTEGELEWIINVEIASKQTAEWCIKNLTVPQLINMGISIINVD